MATHILCRRFSSKSLTLPSFISRSFSTTTTTTSSPLRTLAAASSLRRSPFLPSPRTTRTLSTRATSSSLNDPNPNWSNRPPKETILLDGCDFEHWLVVVEKPEGDPTRDEIIDSYIKKLAKVVGSEDEARMKLYSVSTRHYYAFGALVSEELSYKIKELEGVRWVLPDSYLNVKEKDYGGEPFINGQAVPYDPKYHEEWVRNNARANERNRRNDRPRNADRSRNFDRRRENVVSRDVQDRPPIPNQGPPQDRPPIPNQGPPRAASNIGGYPQNAAGYPPQNTGAYPPQNGSRYPPQNTGGYPPQNAGPYPPQNVGGYPPQNAGPNPPQNTGGYPPQNAGPHPPQNSGGYPPQNANGYPPQNAPQNAGGVPPYQNAGGFQPNAGWSSTAPNRDQ
ncbi:PREDICTED: multiple organellar RNA editing factor 8, chloroplastic/mitochondrial-like isoform X2 [Lupinus angustifolius]|uniref:multiple organellar RNA editing factor 8, chloroplastic/mitochondrial-like isoform X2 n=1 Tax=Lupinus angustifolius TaxID=3871 RepID=UPI00092E336E|nr:PREDICTED: multiple organellar RNA editing factor 8, chloroplastic/mitochondrial-like isoform X2 [Lupinus angustifolius]